MSAGTEVAVTVRGIAAGGSGVADLPDGRVVFVPRTAPGDRVNIRIEKSKPRWALGSLASVVQPGPERRDALCALYDSCGGCQLQHLPYEHQLAWKARFVQDALARIGGLAAMESPEVVPSPLQTGYRNRVTFTLRRLGGSRVVAGFHALGRPAHIVDVRRECVLPRPAIVDAWQALRSSWGEGARLLPEGGRLRLTLREEGGSVVLVVEGGGAAWSAQPLAEAVPSLAAIWHWPSGEDPTHNPRLVAGSAEAGSTAFAQVNPEAAALLVDHVVSLAGDAKHVVDAYCGGGRYARPLAARGSSVTGIELDPAACADARRGAPDGLLVLEGRVEDLLEDVLPADLLIVNPPRSGLDGEVVRIAAAQPPRRILYVSCDPATLARDVGALANVYEARAVRCFDLFPQTAHVETVLELRAREEA
ncbi:MAG: class I SAM-dependent RNA methyltransferase [Gemmatimonadetes bacterium]|nr:class I SAM-dependent RNA methyltransferase [Gemmatimonadota bacterium]